MCAGVRIRQRRPSQTCAAPPRPALHAALLEGAVRWTHRGRWRQAFWIFSGLCSRVCALYFGEGLTGIQVDAAVVEQLVEERAPACARQVGARTPLRVRGEIMG
eukprot:COSAG01_NODE_698_length_14177_cov_13.550039_10_plen_104_part_00